MDLFDTPSASGAVFSPCGLYRYRLWRTWDADRAAMAFIGLNPSTADATADDPTIRRCIAFAKDRGCGGLVMLNLFAFRATDPKVMLAATDPVGPDNDRHIQEAVAACCPVVCAWGTKGGHRGRNAAVRALLARSKVEAYCLRRTKAGHPEHPLYVPKDVSLLLY